MFSSFFGIISWPFFIDWHAVQAKKQDNIYTCSGYFKLIQANSLFGNRIRSPSSILQCHIFHYVKIQFFFSPPESSLSFSLVVDIFFKKPSGPNRWPCRMLKQVPHHLRRFFWRGISWLCYPPGNDHISPIPRYVWVDDFTNFPFVGICDVIVPWKGNCRWSVVSQDFLGPFYIKQSSNPSQFFKAQLTNFQRTNPGSLSPWSWTVTTPSRSKECYFINQFRGIL